MRLLFEVFHIHSRTMQTCWLLGAILSQKNIFVYEQMSLTLYEAYKALQLKYWQPEVNKNSDWLEEIIPRSRDYSFTLFTNVSASLTRMIVDLIYTEGIVSIRTVSPVLLIDAKVPDSFFVRLSEFQVYILQFSIKDKIFRFLVLGNEPPITEIE